MLVLRLVSLGPESAVQSLLSTAMTSSTCDTTSASTSTSTSTKTESNGIERQESYGKNHINSNGTYGSNSKNKETGNNGNMSSKIGRRIVSVEQKMQRTAAQKLQAERLVLGHGIFDMGSTRKDGGDSRDCAAATGNAKGESEYGCGADLGTFILPPSLSYTFPLCILSITVFIEQQVTTNKIIISQSVSQ